MNEIVHEFEESKADAFAEYSLMLAHANTFANVPKMDVNPFMAMLDVVIKQKWQVKAAINNVGNVEYTDPSTGEVMMASQNKIITRQELVDNEKFLKIYSGQLKEVFNLSHQAYKVFGYFLNVMQDTKDSDQVIFDIDECMEFCEVNTHPMVYKGLLELTKKMFICRTNKPWAFYVNPAYAFNGNRLIVYREYVRKDPDALPEKKDNKRSIENW
jgi:hypothetical protein